MDVPEGKNREIDVIGTQNHVKVRHVRISFC